MDIAALLLEIYDRIPPLASDAVDGLDAEGLVRQPSPGANTIGWLIWHLARVQDHHISELTGDDQLWESGDWAASFGLDPDPSNTGYGHDADEVRAVRPESAGALVDYLAATHERATTFLAGLTPDALDEIVDRSWDPPVTLGVRLVSVADDCLQHVGQAAYVRGLLDS